MSEARKIGLSCNIVRQRTGKHQCPFVSIIQINLDKEPIATATLAGDYSEVQALRTFKKEPTRFKKTFRYCPLKGVIKRAMEFQGI